MPLTSLPSESLHQILSHLIDNDSPPKSIDRSGLLRLMKTCKLIHELGRPYLYKAVHSDDFKHHAFSVALARQGTAELIRTVHWLCETDLRYFDKDSGCFVEPFLFGDYPVSFAQIPLDFNVQLERSRASAEHNMLSDLQILNQFAFVQDLTIQVKLRITLWDHVDENDGTLILPTIAQLRSISFISSGNLRSLTLLGANNSSTPEPIAIEKLPFEQNLLELGTLPFLIDSLYTYNNLNVPLCIADVDIPDSLKINTIRYGFYTTYDDEDYDKELEQVSQRSWISVLRNVQHSLRHLNLAFPPFHSRSLRCTGLFVRQMSPYFVQLKSLKLEGMRYDTLDAETFLCLFANLVDCMELELGLEGNPSITGFLSALQNRQSRPPSAGLQKIATFKVNFNQTDDSSAIYICSRRLRELSSSSLPSLKTLKYNIIQPVKLYWSNLLHTTFNEYQHELLGSALHQDFRQSGVDAFDVLGAHIIPLGNGCQGSWKVSETRVGGVTNLGREFNKEVLW